MAAIINLNKVRKAKQKVEQKERADANRILHGLPKSEKLKAKLATQKRQDSLDGKKLPENEELDQDQ